MPRANPETRLGTGSRYEIANGVESYSYSNSWTAYARYYSSVNSPGFHSLKARELPANPHSVSIEEKSDNQLTVSDTIVWDNDAIPNNTLIRVQDSGESYAYPDDYSSDLSNGYALALNQALSNMKDMKVNLAQAFGERKQTVNMIGNTATRLAGAFRSLRKFDIHGTARALGVELSARKVKRLGKNQRASKGDGFLFASNSWLEYKFGWLPLLSDVRGAAEALAKYHASDYSVGSASGKHHFANQYIYKIPIGVTGSIARTSTVEVTTRVKFRFRTKDGLFNESPNMGLSDPLLLAWELLPYSFVVDWFLPVGDYLGNLTASNGLQFLSGTRSTLTKEEGTTSIGQSYGGDLGSGIQTVTKAGGNWRRYTQYSRGIYYDFPGPALPVVKNPFSVNHVITGIALLTQAFRR